MSFYQMLDSAKELTLGAASTASRLVETTTPDDASIRRLLNSSSDRDKEHGMREILAKVGSGQDAHEFYADVVKNVYAKDISVREMVASYLVIYSEHEPELTLMIVNSVQRMLGDPSAVVRVQALRLVSALRVETVAPIVVHLISDMLNDVSPLVKIACCEAIGKCYELDPSLSSDLLGLLSVLLASPRQLSENFEVAGWALATIALYWPQRLDLLHSLYRAYVPHIAQFDEWCQVLVSRMLVRYCRHYIQGPDDDDCKLLVNSVAPLLSSINDAVVVEAAATILYVGTEAQFSQHKVAEKVLLLEPTEIAWSCIVVFCEAFPEQFRPFRSQIILKLVPDTLPAVRISALQAVRTMGGPELSRSELAHLKFCAMAWQDSEASVRAVMETMTTFAGATSAQKVVKWLVKLATGNNQSSELVSESLMALRVLIQQHKFDDSAATLTALAELGASDLALPSAKATITWLIGTHSATQTAIASELLRKSLPTLVSEAPEVRLQIIQLAAKLLSVYKEDPEAHDSRIPAFFDFAIELAKYDPEIDIRDRARLFSTLLNDRDGKMAVLLLQAEKPSPLASTHSKQHPYIIDTSSSFFGKRLDGYSTLESWSQANDTRALRETSPTIEVEHSKPAQAPPSAPDPTREVKQMSLEEFLNPSKVEKESGDDEESSSDEDSTDGDSNEEDSSETTSGSESSGSTPEELS